MGVNEERHIIFLQRSVKIGETWIVKSPSVHIRSDFDAKYAELLDTFDFADASRNILQHYRPEGYQPPTRLSRSERRFVVLQLHQRGGCSRRRPIIKDEGRRQQHLNIDAMFVEI